MDRAIHFVEENTDLMKTWCGEPYCWEPAHVIQSMYPRPFLQGAPSRECGNPNCTAAVVRHSDAVNMSNLFSAEEREDLFGDSEIDLSIPSRPVRRDSLTTFALY